MLGIESKKVFHFLLGAGIICALFAVKCISDSNNNSNKEYFKEYIKKLPPEERREFLRMRAIGKKRRLFPSKSVGCSYGRTSSGGYGSVGVGAGGGSVGTGGGSGAGTGGGGGEQSIPVSEVFREIWRLYTPSAVGQVYLSRDGRYLYAIEDKVVDVSYGIPTYAYTKFYVIEIAPDNSTGTIKWVWEPPELNEVTEEEDAIINLFSVGPDGTIYVSVILWVPCKMKEILYAIDPSTGAIKWSKLLWQEPSEAIPLGISVSDDGVIYTAGGEGWYRSVTTCYSVMCNRVSPECVEKCSEKCSSVWYCPESVCPLCFETGWGDCQAPYIYAINPDGTEKWRILVEPPYPEAAYLIFFNNMAIGSDGTLYASVVFLDPRGVGTAYVYAISPEGVVKWRKIVDVNEIGANQDARIAALGPDDTVYFATFPYCMGECPRDDPSMGGCNPTPKILALDPRNGNIKWEYPFHKDAYTINNVVVGYDGTIYASGLSDIGLVVVALNPDGSVKWKGEYVSACMHPWIFAITRYGAKEFLYLGSTVGLYLIDAGTGQLLTFVDRDPREDVVVVDIVVLDGVIYMPEGDCRYWPGSFFYYCGYNPRILSLKGLGPLSNSSWPMRRADNHATQKINTNR